jgi:hypothetical protein
MAWVPQWERKLNRHSQMASTFSPRSHHASPRRRSRYTSTTSSVREPATGSPSVYGSNVFASTASELSPSLSSSFSSTSTNWQNCRTLHEALYVGVSYGGREASECDIRTSYAMPPAGHTPA